MWQIDSLKSENWLFFITDIIYFVTKQDADSYPYFDPIVYSSKVIGY